MNLSNKFWYGGDYNPDQWLDRPDILEEDIRLMKEASVNCVSVGIFAWSALEPEEGVWDLDWMEEMIERLDQNGIKTILATPSGAMPPWLCEAYPEVMMTLENGSRRFYGNRHNFCPTSPVMREKTKELDQKLAQRFGHHPGVILWHISNEMGGNGTEAQCHCPLCQEAFRGWLKKKYGDLDSLNRAWYTSFWSHRYTRWSQIHSPSGQGENLLHGLKLDWKRFTNDQLVNFAVQEIDAVKKYSDRPVTTNMMAYCRALNYSKWAGHLDIISWDNYPYWHSEESEIPQAAEISAQHSLFRSLKGQPFLMMESTPSAVNWRPENILKRPGMNALSSMQAIAHGSASVQYFQWRQSRGGSEKYHGAVVGHLNGSNTRVFRDCAALGKRLAELPSGLAATCNHASVAVVYDAENRWAIEDTWAVDNKLDYYQLFLQYYRPLWEKGIDTDIVDMESDLSRYALVIAPYNYMYRGDYVKRVAEYIAVGGVYVTTCWSGEADENDLCFLDEHPLRKVLGIRTEEADVPNTYWPNQVVWEDRSYEVTGIVEIVHAETASVMARCGKDFYAGAPALTGHAYGKGKAYYIAAECGLPFLRDCYDVFLKAAGVSCGFHAALPEGVTVNRRVGENNQEFWFLQNYNRTLVTIEITRDYRDLESGELCRSFCRMDAFSCRILQEAGEC